jgi:Double-GTPase 2
MSEVHCPICHRRINWNATQPYRIGADGTPEQLVRDPLESEASWRDRLITAYRPCRPVTEPGAHLLPYDYADYTPITIGMIGRSKAGKTHLLAAMIYRLCSNDPALGRLGLRVGPLDLTVHQKYVADNITPLIGQRRELMGTPGNQIDFCDALKVTNAANRSFALIFFDLAGERLTEPNDDEVRFYASANALVFVVDPDALPKRLSPHSDSDASFDVALRRLDSRPRPSVSETFLPVAAAVVVAKADLIRFDDRLVSDWLAVGSAEEEVDLSTVESESEDVYAYLTQRGAARWLRPAQECSYSTLHFASATNGPAADGVFPGAFRQCRVLKPLLAVFAMTGILDEKVLLPLQEPG